MDYIIEGLKILAPVASAVFIAIYVNRKNEGVKTELTRKLNSFQTRDTVLHQRRLEALERIYELIIQCTPHLHAACIYTKGSALYDYEDPEKLSHMRSEQIREYLRIRGELYAYYQSKKIFLDEATCEDIDAVIDVLDAAATPFDQDDFMDEMLKGAEPKAKHPAELRNWFLEINKVIPALDNRLRERVRMLVSPDSE